jgi:hypothetical protein
MSHAAIGGVMDSKADNGLPRSLIIGGALVGACVVVAGVAVERAK